VSQGQRCFPGLAFWLITKGLSRTTTTRIVTQPGSRSVLTHDHYVVRGVMGANLDGHCSSSYSSTACLRQCVPDEGGGLRMRPVLRGLAWWTS